MSGQHRKPTTSTKKVAKIPVTGSGSRHTNHAGSNHRSAGADEAVDDVGSVDDVLAADSDELEADDPDDDPDDEREELVSIDSANAIAGVFATAAPTPSANANAPARTIYCAFTGIALRGQPARAPAQRPPEPP